MRNVLNTAITAAASMALTVGLVAYADPAFADAPVASAPQITIPFDRAAIATSAGHTALERRIRMAASRVCDTNDASARMAELSCRVTAVTRAEQQLARQVAQQPDPAVQIAAR